MSRGFTSGAHAEVHRSDRVGWLRAGVLGANDGIVSISSLVVGVASAQTGRQAVLVAGLAGLVAGALSMAIGEYVSVSSQRDAERADIARESKELEELPDAEFEELTAIYEERGLDRALAEQVAKQLMEKDALRAHLRDELGFTESTMAKPVQAAVVSALSFAVGGGIPLLAMALAGASLRIVMTASVTTVLLVALGATGGALGGASAPRAAVRVTIGGIAAMALTAAIGALVGISL
jgi:VIT1/CCC1 family predicted Fe2+/Mn2+ transporter